MKFVHTADLHFGGIPAIGKMTEHGIREREYDLVRALDNIIGIANKEEVDTMFIAGDIFHVSNPDSTSRKFWTKFLADMIEGKAKTVRRLFIVAGNHDIPNNDVKANSLQSYSNLVPLFKKNIELYLCNEFTYMIKGEFSNLLYGIICIPYIEDKEKITEYVLNAYAEMEDEVSYFIIIAHIEIKEAELGASDMKLKHGFSYEDPIFQHPKLIYAALGHIHKAQRFVNSVSEASIWYSGSPVSKDFNEAKDHRRVIIGEIIDEGISIKEVQVPDRDFITIENNKGIEGLSSDIVSGSIIKLRNKGTKEEIQKLNSSVNATRLEGMGALQVKVENTVIKEIKEEVSEFSNVSSIPSACKTYIEKYASKGLDKWKLQSMSSERIATGK